MNLLQKQLDVLQQGVSAIDDEQLNSVFSLCVNAPKIGLTGIGKSGMVASTIAASLTSIGVNACSICAQNLLHGDLALLNDGDLIVFFSKSGETQELLALLPALHNKKIQTLAITSREHSTLAQKSDHALTLPCAHELCPFSIIPSNSMVMQQLFGNALVRHFMDVRKTTLAEIAANHPAGSIGTQTTLTIQDRMRTNLPLCKSTDRLCDALSILSEKQCGLLLIIDNRGVLVGIFSDGDLRRGLQEFGSALLLKPLSEIMRTHFLFEENPHTPIANALQKMQGERLINCLPILRSGIPIGVLRLHDILKV